MVSYSDTLKMDSPVYVDTRSPGEFAVDHIPGAINIPILDNEERAVVGTLYTRVGHEEAYEKGRAIYEAKLAAIKSQLIQYKKKKLIIYCWRGGMRSKVITELAQSTGLDAEQLAGGYKKYREHVRKKLESFRLHPRLIVVHGLTGTGKTEIVNQFTQSIDLEGLAQHRSSVFGAVGLEPNSQKRFESLLLHELESKNRYDFLVVEGESRKIGNIIIPEFFWKAMRHGINVRLEAPFEERVKRLCSIYTNPGNIQKTLEIARGLKQLPKRKEIVEHLQKGRTREFMTMILRLYYDPLYSHSLDALEYDLVAKDADAIRKKYNIQAP